MHELAEEAEPSLPILLRRLGPCDLVLVEGYKRNNHPKIEIYRPAVGKPLRQPSDPTIVAIASDERVPEATTVVIDLNNVEDVANTILEKAMSFDAVLDTLEKI
jgi:molybdopterin-guanine dinucleotide biosynthesis protein B